jgi:glycosyltransferase involved in cell wall biosynthesis
VAVVGSLAGVQRERIVFVTQLIDPDDPVLGFVVAQIQALSTLADVVVISNEVRTEAHGLEAEIISLGKEHGNRRVRRGFRYLVALADTIRTARPSAIIAHMCPLYLIAAAPVARTYGIAQLLWFVHADDSVSLHLAERLADVVITALPSSYPRRGPKVTPIGHAIDTDALAYATLRPRDGMSLELLALGRTSPVKGYDRVIRAVAAARHAGVDARLRIVGPSVTEAERRHRSELEELALRCAADAVRVEGATNRAGVAREIWASDVVVNATKAGSADKVVFEAMSCGRPVLASSPAFASMLEGLSIDLRFSGHDVAVLTERIVTLASASDTTLEQIGRELRRRVETEHSLTHWAGAVVALVAERSANRRRRR